MRNIKNFADQIAETIKDVPKDKAIEIWFQDEARVGQKNGQVYQWAKKGTRPRQPADQRYASCYIFGAVCPERDVGAALVRPEALRETISRLEQPKTVSDAAIKRQRNEVNELIRFFWLALTSPEIWAIFHDLSRRAALANIKDFLGLEWLEPQAPQAPRKISTGTIRKFAKFFRTQIKRRGPIPKPARKHYYAGLHDLAANPPQPPAFELARPMETVIATILDAILNDPERPLTFKDVELALRRKNSRPAS